MSKRRERAKAQTAQLNQYPFWLFGIGAVTFVLLMYYGTFIFKKGTKIE